MALTLSLGPAGAPLRILCLGAHSDDIEIGCGGTVLRVLEEHPGSEVTWVVLSATPERENEARASAADFLERAGKQTVIVKDFRESFFPYVGADIKDFFEVLKKQVAPELILVHRRADRHQDHRTVAEFAWNTWRNHLVLEYEIPKYEGDLEPPNVFVPLTAQQAGRKVELLMKHFGSQRSRSWFRPETFNGLMNIRAIECNAPGGFAEAFHGYKLVL